jgi:ATP-binding cassette subfamily F protein uup
MIATKTGANAWSSVTTGGDAAIRDISTASTKRKLTFNEQRELAQLPATIASLETEQTQLERRTADPGFYKEGAETIHQVLARIDEVERLLSAAYARWDELDSRQP